MSINNDAKSQVRGTSIEYLSFIRRYLVRITSESLLSSKLMCNSNLAIHYPVTTPRELEFNDKRGIFNDLLYFTSLVIIFFWILV